MTTAEGKTGNADSNIKQTRSALPLSSEVARCPTKGQLMTTISESGLGDAVKNNAVKVLNILQTASGDYEIVVQLTWKEGDLHLATARKTVRKWASLDRLVKHIRENYGIPPVVLLKLEPLEKPEK